MISRERREFDKMHEQTHAPGAARSARDEKFLDVVRGPLRGNVVGRPVQQHVSDADERQPLTVSERATYLEPWKHPICNVFECDSHEDLGTNGVAGSQKSSVELTFPAAKTRPVFGRHVALCDGRRCSALRCIMRRAPR